jgi:hypothetical protein
VTAGTDRVTTMNDPATTMRHLLDAAVAARDYARSQSERTVSE